MEKKYSKQVLSELEKVTKKAHDNERCNNLKALLKSMRAWEKGKITDDEMEQIISDYRPIRVIWANRRYLENGDPGLPVVDALLMGSLTANDLSAAVQKELEILKKVVEL